MKKYIFLFFAVCAFSVYANAQNRTGDCTSYTSDDRSVTFYLNDSSARQLRLCSQSTVVYGFLPTVVSSGIILPLPSSMRTWRMSVPSMWTNRMPATRFLPLNSVSG